MPCYLFTADLHLTARPQDAYRWEIFNWLVDRVQKYAVTHLFIVGDLTDSKDNHSSALVNRLINEIDILSQHVEIHLIKGNHDYIDPNLPFFKFLAGLDRVEFHMLPTEKTIAGHRFLILPHVRNYRTDYPPLDGLARIDFVLAHQAFDGAKTSNGFGVTGVPQNIFNRVRKDAHVIAGDIHVPQTVANIVYCGAPYPVAFGDEYKPRVLLFDGKGLKSIERLTIRKMTLVGDHPDAFVGKIDEGDMVRAVLELAREDFDQWEIFKAKIVKYCKQQGATLCGLELRPKLVKKRERLSDAPAPSQVLTPVEMLSRFATGRDDVDEYTLSVGKQILTSDSLKKR
jgi:DNA repair exonuclease SbcCD nuclease subunit